MSAALPPADAHSAASSPASSTMPWASRVREHVRLAPWVMPFVVSAAIVVWQLDFNTSVRAPRAGELMTASSGLLSDLRYFFYFYSHLGLFPVGAKEVPRLGPSRHDALDFVARYGDRLRMDFGDIHNTTRFGDYGKLLTLWPSVWLSGDPAHPSPMPFNQILFVSALLATWWAFWREGRTVLGALVVILVGSNPFQLYETYGRANIFSLPISVALIALAAHLPYLSGRRGLDRLGWVIGLLCGVVLATLREIRMEAAIATLAVLATYLSMRGPWRKRLALALVFVAAWGTTSLAWKGYWARGFERATQFVAQAGGRVYGGAHNYNHALWHAVYCGLGDFGGDRGFAWDDRRAFRWATTRDVTNPRPLPYHYRDGYYFEETYDGVHHVAPTDLPAYDRLVRDRVLSVVRADPLWYLGILVKRVGAILGQATPAALTVGVAQLRLPGVGWLMIPILLFLCFSRRTFEAKLILFMLPLSAVAILVYSGGGMTNYGIAHLVALAVGIDLAVRAARARSRLLPEP